MRTPSCREHLRLPTFCRVSLASHHPSPIAPALGYHPVVVTNETIASDGLGGQLLRPTPWMVAVLMLLALVARLAFLVVISHPEMRQGELHFLEDSDESDYHRMARNLVVDGVYKLGEDSPPTAKRPPGMVLPIAALYALFGPSPWLALGWVMLCSLLTVPLAGWVARLSGVPPPAQVLAMLFAALLPTSLFTAGGIWSEPPSLLLTLLALALLLRADDPHAATGWAAAAGLTLGLAYLVRPSVLAVLVLVAGYRAARAWADRRVAPLVALLLLALLPITLWGLRNQRVFGEWFIGNTESTAALWGANNPVTAGLADPAIAHMGDYDLAAEAASGAYLGSWVPVAYLEPTIPAGLGELERHGWYRQQVREFVRSNPGAFVRLVGYKLWRVLTAEPYAPSILGESPGKRRLKRLVTFGERWFLLLAGGWGLWLLLRRSPWVMPLHLLFLAGSAAVVVIAYVNARIFLPVSGLLLVPAALAFSELVPHRFHPIESDSEAAP